MLSLLRPIALATTALALSMPAFAGDAEITLKLATVASVSTERAETLIDLSGATISSDAIDFADLAGGALAMGVPIDVDPADVVLGTWIAASSSASTTEDCTLSETKRGRTVTSACTIELDFAGLTLVEVSDGTTTGTTHTEADIDFDVTVYNASGGNLTLKRGSTSGGSAQITLTVTGSGGGPGAALELPVLTSDFTGVEPDEID